MFYPLTLCALQIVFMIMIMIIITEEDFCQKWLRLEHLYRRRCRQKYNGSIFLNMM